MHATVGALSRRLEVGFARVDLGVDRTQLSQPDTKEQADNQCGGNDEDQTKHGRPWRRSSLILLILCLGALTVDDGVTTVRSKKQADFFVRHATHV